jgi:hypothetical protein
MAWVDVRYRRIALTDIMKTMRLWLDQRQIQPSNVETVISGSGTLVRLEFPEDAEAAEFAEAFGGEVSRDRPFLERTESSARACGDGSTETARQTNRAD